MTKFDDIRPFYDAEIPAAMDRIAKSEHFPLLAQYVYPHQELESVKALLYQFTTIKDFQLEVMRCVNEQVIARSVTSFTYSGLEQLSPNKRYLFVSNHRDIMLDACLLQYALYQQGHETSEITFGANLMSTPLVIDIGKCNKMFRVERPGGSPREFYKSSLRLSEYIRYCITEKGQSVWIAQRNGRTKDGNDRTDQGIIKMFGMSLSKYPVKALTDLHIVPVSISYEWESCDYLKARELYLSRGTTYKKQPGEDLNSILTGIMQPKGHVQLNFCSEITETDIIELTSSNESNFHRLVANLIDERIISAYQLYPNNYIAWDILNASSEHQEHYTPAQEQIFKEHLNKVSELDLYDTESLEKLLLTIYANPLINKMQLLTV